MKNILSTFLLSFLLSLPAYGKVTVSTPVPVNYFAQAQLQYTSTTQVTLKARDGNKITFPDGSVYTIPSAGLASGSIAGGCYLDKTASSTLVASTLYYVYLWENGGVPKLNFSVTSHSTDTATGVEIKTGDNTQVLVGMVYPQTGPLLANTTTKRLVATWFNRTPVYFSNGFTTNRTLTSTTLAEVNTEIRVLFLSWGDTFNASFAGGWSVSSNPAPMVIAIGVDGVSTIAASQATSTVFATDGQMGGFSGNYAPAEGEHFITIGASTSAGSITFYSASNTGLTGQLSM